MASEDQQGEALTAQAPGLRQDWTSRPGLCRPSAMAQVRGDGWGGRAENNLAELPPTVAGRGSTSQYLCVQGGLDSPTSEHAVALGFTSAQLCWMFLTRQHPVILKSLNASIAEWRYLGTNTTDIVSEEELAQLAQIQPLIFNFNERLAIKNCLKMLANKVAENGITQEFMDLELKNLPGEFNYGNEPLNREKNRYRDILPYDSTRVPLGKSMDYINASYIRIVNHGEENFYIATQGPLPHTTNDFWQMVLENNSNVIAMITRDVEDGVTKCHNYWPISLKTPLELKHLRIFQEKYQILKYFIIRIFQIVEKSTGTSHSVKHLQFTNWPDHGTPTSADDFIKYVRYVRKSHLTGPIVVHCSAGVGRTGVFICVDAVFCAIEKNFSFSFENIVTQMREQRSGMIQTKEQYQFCHVIVLEVLRKLLSLN
ncbi:tyrosine-protein phosphatase non-receptor type 20 [Urocitellus parryii]